MFVSPARLTGRISQIQTGGVSTPTSVSDAALDASEEASDSPCAAEFAGESAAAGCVWSTLGTRGEITLGRGELEGVGPGEGRGERVPISTARSSVQGTPRLRRNSSVSLSTTSSLVRCGTSRIRSTTCSGGRI